MVNNQFQLMQKLDEGGAGAPASKAGTVEYYCRFHPNMKAVLKIAP